VFTATSSEERREQHQRRNREQARTYRAERDLLAAEFEEYGNSDARSFGDWTYTPGQAGGTFHREGHAAIAASFLL
jgi:hypothetical protein